MARSSVAGAALGGGIAFTIGCSLLEISTNPMFATLFGVSLLLLGAIVLWRALAPDLPPSLGVRLLTGASALLVRGPAPRPEGSPGG